MSKFDEKLAKAIQKIVATYKEEYGEQEFEDGDEIVSIFNDAVIIISKEGVELSVKVHCGEPYRFDENAFE